MVTDFKDFFYLGIIHCQILLDQLDEAQQQLEFFREIQSSIGKTAVSVSH